MTTPQPRQRCRLDDLSEEDFDRGVEQARAMLKSALGLSDDQLASAGRSARAYVQSRVPAGALADCQSVKTNAYLTYANLGLQSVLLLVLLAMVRTKSKGVYRAWALLGLCSTLLVAVQMRSSLSLAGKVLWYGSGTETKGLLVVTALYVFFAYAFQFSGDVQSALATWLIGAMIVIGLARIVFMARAARTPDASYIAVVAALDRMISSRKIEAARQFMTPPPS